MILNQVVGTLDRLELEERLRLAVASLRDLGALLEFERRNRAACEEAEEYRRRWAWTSAWPKSRRRAPIRRGTARGAASHTSDPRQAGTGVRVCRDEGASFQGAVLACDGAGLDRAVLFAGEQHAPGDDPELTRQGDHSLFVADLDALPAKELAERSVIAPGKPCRRFHQYGAQERVAALADAAMVQPFARLDDGRIQPNIAAHLFRNRKALGVTEASPQRGRGNHPDIRDRQELPDLWHRLYAGRDFGLDRMDLGVQRGQLTQRTGEDDPIGQGDRSEIEVRGGVLHAC